MPSENQYSGYVLILPFLFFCKKLTLSSNTPSNNIILSTKNRRPTIISSTTHIIVGKKI